MQLRTDGVHCRESTGTGPAVLKIVPVTGAAILQVTMDQLMCAILFPHLYDHTYSKSMDQPGKVANPSRGQLKWEDEYFTVRVCA